MSYFFLIQRTVATFFRTKGTSFLVFWHIGSAHKTTMFGYSFNHSAALLFPATAEAVIAALRFCQLIRNLQAKTTDRDKH